MIERAELVSFSLNAYPSQEKSILGEHEESTYFFFFFTVVTDLIGRGFISQH